MGATSSKDGSSRFNGLPSSQLKNKPQDLVDFGTVFPNGLYTSTPQDFDSRVLRQLIIARKLSPFYQGLADVPEQVAEPLPSPDQSSTLSSISSLPPSPQERPTGTCRNNTFEPPQQSDKLQQKAMLYNDAVECPICFLYYPPNINYSRCCEQPICTECFIQIHRPTDDPSNPATCPFCLESNYGVTYTPPAWIDKNQTHRTRSASSCSTGARHTTSGISDGFKSRRKSVSHTHPNVVLIDRIRPNWKESTTTSSRSSRRNSLTTGPSSSGRNLLRVVTRPGRSASSAASTEYNQHWANVRDMNMDLEDWMVMEAIRLSLAEQEEQERSSLSSHTESSASSDEQPTAQQDDDDDQPLAERVNHYQQAAAAAAASGFQQEQQIDSSTSSLSSQDSMDQQDRASDKKSTSDHDSTPTTTAATASGPDMVC